MLHDQEDTTLLKAYISEWSKFFTQCNYLPKPFGPLETALTQMNADRQQKKTVQSEDTIVRKVRFSDLPEVMISKYVLVD